MKALLTLSIIFIDLFSLHVVQAIVPIRSQNESQCFEALSKNEPQTSPSPKSYDPYGYLGQHKIGRFNIPIFQIDEFKRSFEFGITDNPYHAIEISHDRGTYLLINTDKISAQSQIYYLVKNYLFDFIPNAYRSFEGDRHIDESAIASINIATRQIMNKLTLFISLDKKDDINGGMAFIMSLNSYEALPFESEIFELSRKGMIPTTTVDDVLNFGRHSNHRIEGVRTYAKSARTLKSLIHLSGKLLKNEKRNYPSTAILMALISEKTHDLYESVLNLHFVKIHRIKGFSGNEKIDILGEIDIDRIPEG